MTTTNKARLKSAEKVKQALDDLKHSKKQITIDDVALKAGVSRKTIYNNPELLERIKQVQELQRIKSGRVKEKGPDKGTILEARFKLYREENANLKEDKKMLLEENMKLTRQVTDLERKVEELEQTIRSIRERKVSALQLDTKR
jgi:predicted nuclease with TOPRIM domain